MTMKNMTLKWAAVALMALAGPVRGGGIPYGDKFIAHGETESDYGIQPGHFNLSAGFGTLNLNAALVSGLKNSIAPKWDHLTVNKKSTVFVKGEYMLGAHSGVGFNYAWSGLDVAVNLDSMSSLNIPIQGKLKYRTMSVLARYNYHFFEASRFDLYLGAGIGFRNSRISVEDNDPGTDWWNFPVKLGTVTKYIPHSLNFPTIGADMTLGMKYYVLPPIALYMEFGMAKAFLQGGVSVRF